MTEELSLEEKLQAELLDDTPWDALENHFERGAVLLIRGVSLVEVGVALAEDNATAVRSWMEQGLIEQPSMQQNAEWKAEATTFRALIVQPWVLLQAPEAS